VQYQMYLKALKEKKAMEAEKLHLMERWEQQRKQKADKAERVQMTPGPMEPTVASESAQGNSVDTGACEAGSVAAASTGDELAAILVAPGEEQPPRTMDTAREARLKKFACAPSSASMSDDTPLLVSFPTSPEGALPSSRPPHDKMGAVIDGFVASSATGSVQAVEDAITEISTNSMDEKVRAKALRILGGIVKNIIEHPDDPKYRSINTQSKAFLSKLSRIEAGTALLKGLGFIAGQSTYELSSETLDLSLFAVASALIGEALLVLEAPLHSGEQQQDAKKPQHASSVESVERLVLKAPPPTVSVQEKSAGKLSELAEMGFTDVDKNLALLVRFSGDMRRVTEELLNGN